MSMGKVYIVGAGCGDYDLITLRGIECLKKCDTVVYDSLVDNALLEYTEDTAEKICAGKRAGMHSEKQSTINNILVVKAKSGKTVVRLKGGDPFVFGRGGEEVLALQENNIPYSVVPGVTSAIAVPELAGIPVTHRNLSRSLHIITGHTAQDTLPDNLKEYAKLKGTLVFLMGIKKLPQIVQGLVENGKSKNTPAAVVSNGAYAVSQTVRGTLENICSLAEEKKVVPPAIIVVGETAAFDLSPTLEQPLKNISVTVTGTQRLAHKLSKQLSALGADTRHLDYLNVIEYQSNPLFEQALNNIDSYHYVVLTSMNGAEIFLKRLHSLKIDIRSLANIKFAVIGTGTASVLEKNGIFADLIPRVYTSAELGRLLVDSVEKSDKLLILRAENGSKELTEILDNGGIKYSDIKTYDIQLQGDSQSCMVDTDFITFASSSGVKSFFEKGYSISAKTKIVCIGEITARALLQRNIKEFNIAKTKDVHGVVNAILKTANCEADTKD